MEQEQFSHLQNTLLGREFAFQASEEVGIAVIRRFAAAIGDRNPSYWDEEYARESLYGGIIAPPTLVFELTFDIGGEMEESGLYKGFDIWFSPVGDIQRLGNEYEVFQPLRPDDIVTLRRKVVDVSQKEGKKGTWIFITSEIVYTNQRGELLGIDRETVAGQVRGEVK